MEKETFNSTPIKNYMKENKLTQKQFAERCEISVFTLRRILRGDCNVHASDFVKVVKTIKVRCFDLLGV